jgi:hypothetical protein
LHRFHALVALWWMQGRSLPRIVQNQLQRNKHNDHRKVIRETLSLVEDHIRFRAVRVFTTYNSLLSLAYDREGIAGGSAGIPAIPLFLELGASNRTMISFMELGLTRATAATLSEDHARNRNMARPDALKWIRRLDAPALGLSGSMISEIEAVRHRWHDD